MRAWSNLALVVVICGVAVSVMACRSLTDTRANPPPAVTEQPTASVALQPDVGPTPSLVAPPPLGATPPADSCGPWSAYTAIADQYGEIRDCGRFGTAWAIFTLGKIEPSGQHDKGVIGLYPCAADNAPCLSRQTDHPLAGWEFYTVPYPGGATLLGRDPRQPPDPNVVVIDDGGHQICFSVRQHTFSGPC